MANLSYINSILDEEGIGVEQNNTPAPTPTPTAEKKLSSEELVQMVDEEDAPSEYDQRITDRRKAVFSNIKDFAFDSADLAVAMLGGSGISEAVGAGVENPVSAATRGEKIIPIKSLPQDMDEGNYFDATLKTVGLAGDALQLGGAYTAATGAGIIPGAVMMAGGTALKYGTKAVSKYGDEIVDGLRKLFDIDPDAADRAAEVVDKLADQDKPIAVAQGVLNKQIKIAGRKKGEARSGIGGNNPPEAKETELVPAEVDNLGLFSRAEEAIRNMDIPEEGISGKSLMARLRKDSKVPNDEIEHGFGLMIDPDATITRADLDKMMSNNFGVLEVARKLSKGETEYHGYTQYRLPDEPGSDYTEITYHLAPETRVPVVSKTAPEGERKIVTTRLDRMKKFQPTRKAIGRELFSSDVHFTGEGANQLFHMRTSVRTNKEGKRVLLIEEIQSDAFKAEGSAEGVNVPFKKSNGYTNLALARAMRIAVDNDLDGIAVTDAVFQIKRNKDSFDGVYTTAYSDYVPGDIVDRPDGSSMIMTPTHKVELEGPDTVTELTVDSSTGVVITSDTDGLAGQKLSDLLGSREMADELLNTSSKTEVNFSDRVIGKSGYKAVYDKRIPKRLNTIIKTMDLKDSPTVTKSDINIKADKPPSSVSELSDAINRPNAGFNVYDNENPLMKTLKQLQDFEANMDADDINQFDATASAAFLERVAETARFFYEYSNEILIENPAIDEILDDISRAFPSSGITHPDDIDFLDLDDIIGITARHLREQGGGAVKDKVSFLNIELGLMNDDKVVDAVDVWLSNASKNLDWQLANISSDITLDVPNNNTVIFTPEMRDQIKEKGLPRLRKGGLVGRK